MKTSILVFCFAAFTTFAATQVDQGAPGNQGAWKVTLNGSAPVFPSDGGTPTGTSYSAVYPYPCRTTSPNKVVYHDGGSQNVPGTSATSRLYTVVCNTRDNTTGNLRCRADGTTPTVTAGSAGDVLGVGDCISYTNPSGFPVKCVGLNLYSSTFECVQ